MVASKCSGNYSVAEEYTKVQPLKSLHFLPNVPFLQTHTYAGDFNPYPTAFPYGNGMVLHFYQQQESSTTKTVHKVINKGLKTYV